MKPLFFDCETVGFYGLPIIVQYAIGEEGEVHIHSFWTEKIEESLSLIENFMNHLDGVIAFNIAFDHFHLTKIYNLLMLYCQRGGSLKDYPVDHVNELGMLEADSRDAGYCLKPVKALDLMLSARKGTFQSTMERRDIKVRRIPAILAPELASELNKRIPLKDIFFARSAKGERWHVLNTKDADFKNVVLKFAPSAALKVLMLDILGENSDIIKFGDIEVGKKFRPVEYGFAPYATAGVINEKTKQIMPVSVENWRHTWPRVIEEHIAHWSYNSRAREYAGNDVKYLKVLWKYLGYPALGDDDSELACMVASVRWKGFSVNLEKIKELKGKAIEKSKMSLAPIQAKAYISEKMNEMEKLVLENTKKVTLKEIASWTDHPAAKRAQEILDGRTAKKEIELYDKILQAGRFHASFKVIGTLSSRMAGSDGLNAQAIKKTKEIRSAFNLNEDPNFVLEGGDFDAFEISLMEATYNDPKLREALLAGKKIHALFAMELFPGTTYEQIIQSSGTENDLYLKGKSAIFAMAYGGESHTLETRLGIPTEVAERAFLSFAEHYPGIKVARQKVFNAFGTMRQKGGIGTKVEWHEPQDYIESIFGFRRYFSLENRICKELYNLAENPPDNWKQMKIKVVRRDREQTVSGAIQSALFGAAFQIQASNIRAAGNHVIQSSGAQITKRVQRRIWDIQPSGIGEWLVQGMNIHDEIMCNVKKGLNVKEVVDKAVEEYKKTIPLIKMEWKTNLKSWGEK